MSSHQNKGIAGNVSDWRRPPPSCYTLRGSTPRHSAENTEPPQDVLSPITEQETQQLARCEIILERGLGTFLEVGNALLTIRQGRLYRATHHTFEQYCRERWDIGRSYAWRVIGLQLCGSR